LSAVPRCVIASARRFSRSIGSVGRSALARAVHRRPILFLLGRQLKTGVNCRNARVAECDDVFGARPPMFGAIGTTRTLLRIDKRSTGDRKHGRPGENSFPHSFLQWHF
jgi:hypothetical protein